MGKLDGKVAIVTGAASGIGLETAERFLKEGAKVTFTDVNQEKGQALATKLGDQALFLTQDVSSEDDWINVVQTTLDHFGGLDILVNNAGVPPTTVSIEQVALSQFKHVIDVNLVGTFLGIKHAMLYMKEHHGGSIVNISSMGGIVGIATAADYNASKGGVRLMTKGAALDAAYGKYGVRINSVHPGYIKTGMLPPEAEDMMAKTTPLGHIGQPNDIASACVYLASDDASFVTGTELIVDGGFTAQ